MKFLAHRIQSIATALLLATAGVTICHAQSWPTKPIHILVPNPPGGSVDIIGRLIAEKLSQEYKQSVIVDNVPGAQGQIALRNAHKAPPDGHTLVMTGFSTLIINPAVYPKQQSFSVTRDLTHLAILATSPNILLASPSVTAKTIPELVTLLKANPQKFSIGHAGTGSLLAGELFKSMAGVNFQQVPYNGYPQALVDLYGDRIQLTFAITTVAYPALKTGKAHALGISSLVRDKTMPNIATIAESGYPGFEVIAWHAVSAPAGLPRDIAVKLNASLNRIMQDPANQSRLQIMGAEPASVGSLEQVNAFIAAETTKYTQLVKDAGIEEK